ncbi:Carboxylesterase NlhH [Planctopirus ephydatiae]|uniref:Carboxylesterase NlhH n=1 Tax=Planctopirus ephydatiae TaxID=2528019 RepID=A0A518GNM4_9PLAN|nr:Carboxylesterase NlhH [Planctopirus ephydatiae]
MRTEICVFILLMLTSITPTSAQDKADQAKGKAKQLAAIEEKITIRNDVEYAMVGDVRLKLNFYTPKTSANGPLPCIVWIHGGGWQNGDKSSGLARVGKWVATGDYAGASIGYRLTDVASWPAQIHDCKAAIRYLRANATQLGIDPERIGVWGSSAGGHLVSLLGTSGDVKELEGDLGTTGVGSRVTCVVDYCGPSDFLRFDTDAPKMSQPGQPVYKLFGGPLKEKLEMAKQASPTTHVSKDDPPFLIVHGTADKTVPLDQGVSFYQRQRDAGMSTILVKIEGGGHGIGGSEIESRVKSFFDRNLRGKDVTVSDAVIAANE